MYRRRRRDHEASVWPEGGTEETAIYTEGFVSDSGGMRMRRADIASSRILIIVIFICKAPCIRKNSAQKGTLDGRAIL